MTYSKENELLILGFCTLQALFQIDNDLQLHKEIYEKLKDNDEFVANVFDKHNIFNQSFIGPVLQILLIYPRGLSINTEREKILNKKLNSDEKFKSIICVIKNSYKNEEYGINYLRHLRNSISHSRFYFKNDYFHFKDLKNKKEKIYFKIHKSKIGLLINELNLIYREIIKDIKK